MSTCYPPETYFGFPAVPIANIRDAAKMVYFRWKTDPNEQIWMEQIAINALSDWGESPEMQTWALYDRIRLARVWNGLPDRTDMKDYVWPQNSLSPADQIIWMNNWLPYGNPPGTLPALLDELRDKLQDRIDNPPTPPQPE
jgi:hypothetical protein